MKKKVKNIYSLFLAFVLIASFTIVSYGFWGATEKGGIYWVNSDNSFPRGEWKLIDDDNDGIGYYYYFNDNGFILIDDITPDYKIVDIFGRRIDNDGNEVAVKIEEIKYEEGVESNIYSEEIMAQISQQDNIVSSGDGYKSSGEYLRLEGENKQVGPSPSDFIVDDSNPDGTAKVVLGPNVVLKAEKQKDFDGTMDKKMANYIVSGHDHVKNCNGTIFNKTKWKNVMALKGQGSNIVFENPSNNFNKLKGRIATHNFSYSERTTQCTLTIVDADTEEILYSTSGFNYNAGTSFECSFLRKTNKIRFELDVQGQYTSRVCYLRDCEYGFDREAYQDELYQDEIEEEYNRRFNFGTDSEAEYVDELEFDDQGEKAQEGEDPGTRYRRINGIMTEEDYLNLSEDDEDLSDEIKASISEIKRRSQETLEKQDSISGPAFDENLKNRKETVGPDGSSRVIAGKEE